MARGWVNYSICAEMRKSRSAAICLVEVEREHGSCLNELYYLMDSSISGSGLCGGYKLDADPTCRHLTAKLEKDPAVIPRSDT
jgi:hypothetical protein